MLEDSTLPEDAGAGATGDRQDDECGASVSVGSGEEERVGGEESDRNWAGNRWPRQETLALLKIRSDMDDAFRDSGTKASLWEEVSRSVNEFHILLLVFSSQNHFLACFSSFFPWKIRVLWLCKYFQY